LSDEEPRNLDLSSMTFEEFVEFFFARECVPDEKQFDYYLTDASGQQYDEAEPSSPSVLVGYLTRLFSEFGRIGPQYSLAQVDRAFWGILGVRLRLYDLLWDSATPFAERAQCIRSMYLVYSDFVAKSEVEEMVNCFSMWWDLILHGFWFQTKLFERRAQMGDISKLDAELRQLLDVMFETLKRILALPDRRTQSYALHGLGHLHHPGVREAVQQYIDENRAEFTEDGLRWIEECRDGTVM
jgi:hypothetical protein